VRAGQIDVSIVPVGGLAFKADRRRAEAFPSLSFSGKFAINQVKRGRIIAFLSGLRYFVKAFSKIFRTAQAGLT